MRHYLSIAMLCLTACASPPTAAPALHQHRPTVVPLRTGGEYRLLRTNINGQDAGWFLLDTGSNLSVIAKGTANRMNLPTVGHGQVSGIGGMESFDYRATGRVGVGGFRLPITRMASINLWQMRHNTGTPLAGLIGINALRREVFTLDQSNNQLILGSTFDDDTHVEPLVMRHRLPMVWVTLGEGRRVLMILDTGADNQLTLHRDVVQRWPDVLSATATGPSRSQGVGGHVRGTQTWVSQMRLLGVTLKDVPVTIDPPPPGLMHDRLIAGRIGNALLQHFTLTFDVSHQRIAAVWLPEADQASNNTK